MQHRQTETRGEFKDFIDVYLAEMNTKQSSSFASYFDGNTMLYQYLNIFCIFYCFIDLHIYYLENNLKNKTEKRDEI